jgi:TonB family protein
MKQSPITLALLSLLLFGIQNRSAAAQSDQNTGGRKIVNRVVPAYPPVARSMNLSGTVKLEALVLPNGNVKSVQVKGGNPLLVQAAQNAVHDWKWEKTDHDSIELVEFKFNP